MMTGHLEKANKNILGSLEIKYSSVGGKGAGCELFDCTDPGHWPAL